MNHPKKILLALLFILWGSGLFTLAAGQEVFNEDFLKFFQYRELGPARQCGRILDIEVPSGKRWTFYAAAASGGVWKTVNNGTTFEPLFQNEATIAIGDMAIAPSNPDVLWVGTGEPASGRLLLMGDGVYKSRDAGRTWKNMGLRNSGHIGRIAIHPKNPDIVYVAAVGFHFSFNEERGLFKTEDGGKTWEKSLYISDKVGVVEVAINPADPNIVYAATYDKQRVPWNFTESGPESAIYKSIDAGKTWTKLAGGLPTGKLGRIGIAIYPKNPSILYAQIENSNPRPATEEETKQDRERKQELRQRRVGGELYRSEDAGKTWRKMNAAKDDLGGGKWYGQVRVDPNNDMVVYAMNTPLQRSLDGGKTWGKTGIDNQAGTVHVDHHTVWIDPADSNHILMGSDGGLAVTYDFGKTWEAFDNLPLAQFIAIGVDMDEPYNIYGGLQDNGSVKIPSNSIYGGITRDDWVEVGGGDGQYNKVDPTDSRWLYNAFQNGAIQRVDQKMGTAKSIRPTRLAGQPALRLNWTAPIVISPHNSQILYFGAQVVFRSLDRGDHWQEISPDLTTNDPEKTKGNIEHGTIISISESPLRAGLLWVGTDDGKVRLTLDGGGNWKDLTPNLDKAGAPGDYYVSRVFASNHKEGTAYITKTGFQRDVFTPYVFKTTDLGESWIDITGNLPPGTVYAVVEDHKNPDLLFVGKEMAVYVTINGGRSWSRMKNNMPTGSIMDLLVHPRENDLVVGTYGRGIWTADITPLQETNDKVLAQDAYLFDIEPKTQWVYKMRGEIFGDRQFARPNEPTALAINYYLKAALKDKVKVRITDPYGSEMIALDGEAKAGLNQVLWDMRQKVEPQTAEAQSRFGRTPRGRLVQPGEYVVNLEAGTQKLTKKAVIKNMKES
jgi:photosystem II stability/assembly factor-like uncharacterized protein